MTKLKSKKMTKSTFVIIIMAIAMVAMLAFGGTYAYFTASTEAKSTEFTTGTVSLTTNNELRIVTPERKLVPGDNLFEGDISYTSNSTVDTYVVVKFSFTAKRGETDASTDELAALKTAIKCNVNGTNWINPTDDSTVYIYKNNTSYTLTGADTPNTISFISGGIGIDKNYAENKHEGNTTTSASTVSIEGLTVTISFQAAAIQADNIEIDGDANANSVWTAIKTLVTFPTNS